MKFETKINQTLLNIYLQETYIEDYQLPMLKYNSVPGVLDVKGWEEEGKSCYVYDVSNLISMKTFFEKTPMEQGQMKELVKHLLETVNALQNHMLNPDCLVLDPRYIFRKKDRWWFCYLPRNEDTFQCSFHELTEYFVKTLDYGDTEGIFLAFELHKATLEEHYDLRTIMREYEAHQVERKEEIKEGKEPIKLLEPVEPLEPIESIEDVFEEEKDTQELPCGNAFSLVEEDYIGEQPRQSDEVREEKETYSVWKKARKHFTKKNWGRWDDLIMETNGQEKNAAL